MTTAPLPVLRTNVVDLIPGLVEIGKIKIGKKGPKKTSNKGNEFQAPMKLPYMVVTTLEKGPDDNFIVDASIHGMLGKSELNSIPIVLMFDAIDNNFHTEYSCYKGKTRFCHGDGENAFRLDDKGDVNPVSCPCERLDANYKGDTKCLIEGTLSVIIRGAETVGGVWTLRTKSKYSCKYIMSSLLLIKNLTAGRLAGLPLILTLSPKTTIKPDGASVKIYVVSIEYRGTTEDLLAEGYRRLLADKTYAKRIEMVEQEAVRLLASKYSTAEDIELADETEQTEQTETTAQPEKSVPEKRKATIKKQPEERSPEPGQEIPNDKPEEPEGTESEDAAPDGAQVFGTDGEDPDNDVF